MNKQVRYNGDTAGTPANRASGQQVWFQTQIARGTSTGPPTGPTVSCKHAVVNDRSYIGPPTAVASAHMCSLPREKSKRESRLTSRGIFLHWCKPAASDAEDFTRLSHYLSSTEAVSPLCGAAVDLMGSHSLLLIRCHAADDREIASIGINCNACAEP